ncbi:ArsR/SmtB family transcription factor [Kozakia baliensis]|uniref:ArsR/SmtB family transcription factor n=1 Tax=Kozakia baliensis TaxID=153496 RepID=UPI00087BC431|nr:metalloregulator ArsR/SmtB family transcription factor [Kozakia baliensis]AOX18959.1 hypothetical protein A0U90_00055 [Kozakia baliensis]
MSGLSLEQAKTLADKLRLYSQPQRLMILAFLHQGPATVGEVENHTGIGQPALSQQLGELRRAGILKTWREARAVFYDLADEEEKQRVAWLLYRLPSPTPAPSSSPVHTPKLTQGGAWFAKIIVP